MSVFFPTLLHRRVTDVTKAQLERLGVYALILDVDNTLTTHGHPEPAEKVMDWLEEMRSAGIKLIILSNNKEKRVQPFAQRLGLEHTSRAAKPLPVGFWRAARRLGLPPARIAVVGDQIFTDILGGNWFGAATILVEPIRPETGWVFRLKRRLEVRILRRYRKQGGGQYV